MEVGEQQLAFAYQRVLASYRFLDLDNHFGDGIDFFDGRKNLRTGFHILFIGKAAVDTCGMLHVYRMTSLNQFAYSGRSHGHAIFIVLDFFRNSDNHNRISLRV